MKFSEMSRSIIVDDTDYILLGTDLDGTPGNKVVSIDSLRNKLLGDTSNNYINLTSEDGSKNFRLILDRDGELHIYPVEAWTSTPYTNGDNLQTPFKLVPSSVINTANNSGLIINQIYGGGSLTTTETSVSHNFVELYNCNNVDINLNGVYLWYKPNGGAWTSLALKGIIPPYHSFLVRGSALYNIESDIVRCKIRDYDQDWNQSFSPNGFSMYLCVGSETPEDVPTKYTMNEFNVITETNDRWIDLIGGGGTSDSHTIAVYEGDYYNMGMSVDCSLRRENFNNGINSRDDTVIVNYKTCDIKKFRPRCIKDGSWFCDVDKIQFNTLAPSMVNMCYGKNGNTSRTFTFQTPVTDYNGMIMYRKVGTDTWKKKTTDKQIVSFKDTDVNIHRVIINDLTYGTYEYKLGVEGMLTEIETFEVKEYNQTNSLKMLWTTDEQGFTEYEYSAVKTVAEAIEYYETTDGHFNFDCHLNTGDISQNASLPHEWRYYFKYHENNLRKVPHLITCG